jgi:hypothetical protein
MKRADSVRNITPEILIATWNDILELLWEAVANRPSR